MNSENEKNEEYLEKKNDMSPIVKRLFNTIVVRGIDNTVEIGKVMYEKENINDKKKRDNVRQNKKQMYDLFLGQIKSNNKNKGFSRDEEFINYIMMNEHSLLHPRLRKKYSKSNFENKNRSILLEQNSFIRLPLKARTKNRRIVTLVDYCDKELWYGKRLLKIKGSEKAGKTTEIEAFTQLCKDRVVKEVIKIDFSSINEDMLKNAGSFMNWFIDKIDKEIVSEDKISNETYKQRINDDPCDGSYEYMKDLTNKIEFDSEDNFLLIIIDDIDKLFDYHNIANIFYFYLRQVFQGLERIRQVITYSTECYLKLNDLHSLFNVGESLTLCGFDLEDIQKLLELNNVELCKEKLNILLDYMGTSPYLWQITISYLKESEFEIKDFQKKAIANEDIRAFFYRVCETIEKDEQLLDKIIDELLEFNYLEEPGIRVSYVLEGLGVIKRVVDDRDRWTISCGIYEYFLKTNIRKETQKRNFSKTCKSIKIEDNGRLSAICMTRDGRSLQVEYDLNDRIANIDGHLEWSRKGNYADSCENCHIDFVDGNGDAYLVCDCQRPDDSWNTTQLNLDKRIDNTDGELRYYRRRIIHESTILPVPEPRSHSEKTQ